MILSSAGIKSDHLQVDVVLLLALQFCILAILYLFLQSELIKPYDVVVKSSLDNTCLGLVPDMSEDAPTLHMK